MLQNAVNAITELTQVKNTADQMGTTSGTMLTYVKNMTLLLSAASAYDDQFKSTKSKHHVILHEFQHDKEGSDDYHYHSYNLLFSIDYPVSSILTYATNFCPHFCLKSSLTKIQMPSIQWFRLSDFSKAILDRLDDQAIAIILDYVPPTNTNSYSHPPLPKPYFKRLFTGKSGFAKSPLLVHKQTFLKSLLMKFYWNNMHALKYSDDIEVDIINKPVDPPPETRLITTAKSKSNPIHPGGIQCVISKSSTRHVNLAQDQ
jgi:hypothetical protein